MHDNNSVHLMGTVKRDAKAANGVMDFALEVVGDKGRLNIFDCRLTAQSDAWPDLEGFVDEGEQMEVMGHLEKRTYSEQQRVAGVLVDIRNTLTIVYVDNVVTED